MGRRVRRERAGWDLAAGALLGIFAVLMTLLPERFPGSRWMLITLAVAIVIVYAVGARPYVGIHEFTREPSPAASAIVQSCLIVPLVVGVAIEPNMLLLQTLVLPLIWMTSRSVRQSVIVTIVNAVLLGTAYAFRGGFAPEQVLAGFFTCALSAAFSITLGLWITRIAEWGAERQRLLADLTAAQSGLAAANREAGAMHERARLAREVHDTIAQSLTSIVMLSERARRDGSPQALELIEESAREALQESRALVSVSSASEMTDTLGDALHRLGDRFTRETGMNVSVDADEGTVPRDLQVVLLRCAQEGLANVRKHSGARTVSMDLALTSAHAQLTVRDDGRGLGGVVIDDDRGFGLTGMRDRVALVGGDLVVQDAAAGGAELVVRVPLADRTPVLAPEGAP